MIRVSVSYGFWEDNRYNLDTIPPDIQWALYKYERYTDTDLDILTESNINVNVIHLPLDTCKISPIEIMALIDKLYKRLGTTKFVVHPNKGIENFINYYQMYIHQKYTTPQFKLCIENFQWRKKKRFRTPIEILKVCMKDPYNLSICFDTSHAEEMWFDPKIMYSLLSNIEVIHLSNRNQSQKKQHMAFNINDGDLNLMSFVNYLKFMKWNGDIVLEYMPDYKNKLMKNYYFLKEFFNVK